MRFTGVAVVLSLCFVAPAAASITGDYLEARTSDVYTGPCFANSEVNLTGKEAILAWRIGEGSWDGVPLAGLAVAAVIRGAATLGDPHANAYPMRAVVIVDERAAPEQQRALVGFARAMGGRLLEEVVRIEPARITAEFGNGDGVASLRAGEVAEVRTRGLRHCDRHCGNEEVYYPPLVDVPDAVPAFTLVHAYRGEGLNGTWSSPAKRSAFVGTFSR